MVVFGGITLFLTVIASSFYRPLPQKTKTVQFPKYTPTPPAHPRVSQLNPGIPTRRPHQPQQPPDTDLEESRLTQRYTESQYDYVRTHSLLQSSGPETILVTIRRSAPIFCVVPSLVEDSGMFDSEYMQQPNVISNNSYKMMPELKESLDFSFFSNSIFNMFNFVILLFSCGYVVVYMFIPVWSLAIGSNGREAALLVCIMGVVITVTQLVFGCFADKIPRNRLV